MSDTGASLWDIFFLTNFSVASGATDTISMTAAVVTAESNAEDELSSDPQAGSNTGPEYISDITTSSGPPLPPGSTVAPGDTIQDTFSGSPFTYIGQGVITTDFGSVTALFTESQYGTQNIVTMYVPEIGGNPQFAKTGLETWGIDDFIAKNPTVTITGNSFTLGPPPCFMAGTMIATPDGQRAVETLRPGDLVLTAGGAAKPVAWLGRSTHTAMFADPVRILPVRIKAGALGENVPARDLLVSPGHAMLVDGVLVHAGAMINGTTIVRETGIKGQFVYYHVDIGAHGVLMAEGAETESFLTGVEEIRFDNWDERTVPAEAVAQLDFPRVKSTRQLPSAVRELLQSRAAAMEPTQAAA